MLYGTYSKLYPIVHLIHSCIAFFMVQKLSERFHFYTSKKNDRCFSGRTPKDTNQHFHLRIKRLYLRFETFFQRSLLLFAFVENEIEPWLSLIFLTFVHYTIMLVHNSLTTLSNFSNSKKFSLVNAHLKILLFKADERILTLQYLAFMLQTSKAKEKLSNDNLNETFSQNFLSSKTSHQNELSKNMRI